MDAPLHSILDDLRALLGERLSTNAAIRADHGHGQESLPPVQPDAVAFVETVEEISKLLALCNANAIPVTPFGAGSSLEGHVIPVHGGISLDLSRMNRILAVNQADMDCRIQAGVTREQLNTHLRDAGLFFPVDPGAAATIGGMCATRASGTNAVRYGTIRENVLGMTVVLADGRIVRTGGRVRKSATGYDLTRLFVGSEGTLGVIAEIQLRLHGIPEASSAAFCQFTDLESAVRTVTEVMQAGIPIARIELLDDLQARACIAYSRLTDMEPLPTLLFEFHGTHAGVAEQAQGVEEIAGFNGGRGFRWATDAAERAQLWKARHDAYWAALALRPGARGLTTDAVVPVSRLAEAVMQVRAAIEHSGITAPIVGHVGDGNFHCVILVPEGEDGQERAWKLDQQIVGIALSLGGSCSGEHGVGLGKRDFLIREHGAEALEVMRAIKATFDPRGILNPGKMFPD